MRRAAQVDRNQAEIVAALRAVGCSVVPMHAVGEGCPDLAVGRAGVSYWIEVKDGARPPSERRLTPAQVRWHAEWRGKPPVVVTSVAEALAAIGVAT